MCYRIGQGSALPHYQINEAVFTGYHLRTKWSLKRLDGEVTMFLRLAYLRRGIKTHSPVVFIMESADPNAIGASEGREVARHR